MVWGESEFFKYTFVVGLGSSISTLICVFIYANLINNYDQFLKYTFCGFSSTNLAYLISYSQLRGEKEIPYLNSIKSKNLPFCYFSIMLIIFLLGFNKGFLMMLFSYLLSWIYLRYFQTKGENRGDDSESFVFSSLFPSFLKPILNPIFSIAFFLCGRFFPKPTGSNQTFNDESFVVIDDDEESKERTKRHRARAVDVLNERLALLEEAERLKSEKEKK